MKSTLHIFLLVLFSLSLCGMDIVKNGKKNAYIFLPENAEKSQRTASEILAVYLGKMTGEFLQIKNEYCQDLSCIKFVKLSPPYAKRFASLADTGFAIESTEKTLTIYGKRDRAFPNAVYFLLREYGGVRFSIPGRSPLFW